MKTNTICVQGGYTPGNGEPRQIPIVQSTTFKYDTSEDMGKLFDLEACAALDPDLVVLPLRQADTAPTLEEALRKAYAATDRISFDKMHKRTDIGARALAAMR